MPFDTVDHLHQIWATISIIFSWQHFLTYFLMVSVDHMVMQTEDFHSLTTSAGTFSIMIDDLEPITPFHSWHLAFIKSRSVFVLHEYR